MPKRKLKDAKLDRQSAVELLRLLPDRNRAEVRQLVEDRFGAKDRRTALGMIAESFGVSVRTVEEWVKKDAAAYRKIAKSWGCSVFEVREWIRASCPATAWPTDYVDFAERFKLRLEDRHDQSILQAQVEGRHGRWDQRGGKPRVEPETFRHCFRKARDARDAGKVPWNRTEICRRIALKYGVTDRTVRKHVRDLAW